MRRLILFCDGRTGVLVFSLVTGVIPSTRSHAYLYFSLVTGVIQSTRSYAYLYFSLVTGVIPSTRSQAYLYFSLVTGVIPSTRSQAYLYFLLVTSVIPSTRPHAYLYLSLVTGAIPSTRSQAYLYLSLVTGAITSKRSSVLWWLTEKLGLVAENLSFGWVRLVTVGVLWLFLTVSWVGLQCVIVVFPVHTRLLLGVCCHFQTCHRDELEFLKTLHVAISAILLSREQIIKTWSDCLGEQASLRPCS